MYCLKNKETGEVLETSDSRSHLENVLIEYEILDRMDGLVYNECYVIKEV